jgi:hypothetical protein
MGSFGCMDVIFVVCVGIGGSIILSVINVNIGIKILWIIWEFGST